MSSAAPVERRPLWWWALWFLLGAAFAIQAVRIYVAEGAVRQRNGDVAASIRPQNAWGRAFRADGLLQRGKPELAAKESLAALDQSPLALVAVRTLAMSREKMSGPGAGESAWQAASLMGWRDKQTQLWGVLRAMSNGEAQILAMRADALLRTGDRDGQMAALLRQLMVEPAVRAAFVERLTLNPPWRHRFLTVALGKEQRELDGLVATLHDLSGTTRPPARAEIRTAVESLIAARRFGEALALHRLATPGAASNQLLDDGGFDRDDRFYRADGGPFDWRMSNLNHASASLDESGRRSATVTTSGGGSQIALRRYVGLTPGRYRLKYVTRGDQASPNSLGVRLVCAGQSRPIAESHRTPLRSDNWESREVVFAVSSDCPIILLGVGSFGAEAAEAQYDDFVIERPDAASARGPAS